jgi:glycosyltransferase involved in cell wall biosynthesis
MKLVIQIPALNEEATLPLAIAALPRGLPGFTEVAILVIDDGSSDRTSEVARSAGADRVVRFATHHGLAAAFRTGLEEALAMGADVIVNFDADLQYDPADLPALIAPILADRADVVIGDRSPGSSPISRRPNGPPALRSWMVRQVSGVDVTTPPRTPGVLARSGGGSTCSPRR